MLSITEDDIYKVEEVRNSNSPLSSSIDFQMLKENNILPIENRHAVC